MYFAVDENDTLSFVLTNDRPSNVADPDDVGSLLMRVVSPDLGVELGHTPVEISQFAAERKRDSLTHTHTAICDGVLVPIHSLTLSLTHSRTCRRAAALHDDPDSGATNCANSAKDCYAWDSRDATGDFFWTWVRQPSDALLHPPMRTSSELLHCIHKGVFASMPPPKSKHTTHTHAHTHSHMRTHSTSHNRFTSLPLGCSASLGAVQMAWSCTLCQHQGFDSTSSSSAPLAWTNFPLLLSRRTQSLSTLSLSTR